jgi:spore germination protein GerM
VKRVVATGALLLAAAGCTGREGAPADRPAEEHGLPATRTVNVYFQRDATCEVTPVKREVSGTHALDFVWGAVERLLEGPTPDEVARGLTTAFPDRDQVWRYAQSRVAFGEDRPYPGEEVTIRRILEEENGVLLVDFSPEIRAYGGEAEAFCALVKQLESTVKQFQEYDAVRIEVDGRSKGALQP